MKIIKIAEEFDTVLRNGTIFQGDGKNSGEMFFKKHLTQLSYYENWVYNQFDKPEYVLDFEGVTLLSPSFVDYMFGDTLRYTTIDNLLKVIQIINLDEIKTEF